MYRLLVVSALISYIAVYNVKTAAASCDYDKVACPCFKKLLEDLDEDDDHPHSVLDRVVDVFEDGIEDSCKEIDEALKCIEDATKTCDDKDTGKCKTRYANLKVAKKLLCVDKKQVLMENAHCLNTTSFQSEINVCDAHLKGFDRDTKKPPCEVLQKTADCIDDVVEQCPPIRGLLDDMFDMYLQAYFQVGADCDLDVGDDAASWSLSVSLLLVGLVASYFTVLQ